MALSPGSPPEGGPENLLLITEDTLRSDAVGLYTDGMDTTPNLYRLGKDGVVFQRTWAQSTYTPASYASYMTSTFVRTHGWNYRMRRPRTHRALAPDLWTLAEVLRDNGFITTGIVNNPHIKRALDFDRGFINWAQTRQDEDLVRLAEEDIANWRPGQRHFLYLHMMKPHHPYRPSADARRRYDLPGDLFTGRAWRTAEIRAFVEDAPLHQQADRKDTIRRAYHAEIFDGDRLLGQVLDALEQRALVQNTAVVFISDHGDEFWEHTFGHFAGVWETQLSVPLVIRSPGLEPDLVEDRLARLVDLAPTLAHLLQIDAIPDDWQGVDLLNSPDPGWAVAERYDEMAITTSDRRKVIYARDGSASFYDLASDPVEAVPLEGTDEIRQMFQRLRGSWEQNTPAATLEGAGAPLSRVQQEENVESLKELGYLD